MGDAPVRVQRQHTGRNTFQDSFNVPAPLLERDVGRTQVAAGRFDLAAAELQFFRHAIKGTHEIADLVGGCDFDAIIQPATRYFLGSLGERCHRLGHKV